MAIRKTAKEEGLTPEVFLKRLESKDCGNVYVLQGEDQTRAEGFLAALRSRLISPGTEDFSLETMTVDKEGPSAGEIIGAAETIPFLGGFRLVIVRHGEELDSGSQEALAEYAEKTAAAQRPDMLLIIRMSSLDRRLKFAKTMQKLGAIIDCEPEPVKDLAEFFLKIYGKNLSREAERTFRDVVGEDRRRVVQEADKLCLYVGERQEIGPEDVLAICAESNLQDEWELKNCLQAGELQGVMKALANLRNDPAGTEEGIFAKLCYILSEFPGAAHCARLGDMRGARVFPGNPRYGSIRRNLADMDQEKLRKIYVQLMYQMIAMRGTSLPKDILDDLLCLSALV